MGRYSTRVRDAVCVSGWPALYLAALVERELGQAAATDRVRTLRAVAAELRAVGEAWQAGTAEPAGAEPAPDSPHGHDSVSVAEAAGVLGCSPGYVRRLAREGRLPAHRAQAGAWRLDRAAVEAEANHRREAA